MSGSEHLLEVVYRIARRLIRPRRVELEGGCDRGAAVFVANHSGAFGPIMVMSCLPFKVHPWVTWEITRLYTCAAYLDDDFTGGELRLRQPLSRLLAELLGPLCVLLMKMVQAVPVYRKSRKIAATMARSRVLLAAGEKLVIFPEKPGPDPSGPAGELDAGFIKLARTFYAGQGKKLGFYPLGVNKQARSLSVGAPLFLNPRRPYAAEKLRLKRQLEIKIADLCMT